MTLSEEVRGLRLGVALSRMDHVCAVGIYGPDALEVTDRLVPRHLYLRDGQMVPTLLLTEDCRVFADVYVVADDQDFILLCEGPSRPELLDHVHAVIQPGEEVEVRDLSERWRMISVNGPYAWELMAAHVGSEIIGLPYLHGVNLPHDVCFRAGKTGEYGYDLLVPLDRVERVWQELTACGEPFDVVEAGLGALDACACENFFYVVRAEGLRDLDPVQLQLQWRVSPDKEGYVGAEAMTRLFRDPPGQRLTCALAASEPPADTPITWNGRTVGEVKHTCAAPTVGGTLVLALLDLAVALPGLRLEAGPHALRTVTPPVVRNRSLFLDPQRHSYRTRSTDTLPDLT